MHGGFGKARLPCFFPREVRRISGHLIFSQLPSHFLEKARFFWRSPQNLEAPRIQSPAYPKRGVPSKQVPCLAAALGGTRLHVALLKVHLLSPFKPRRF